MLLRVGIPLRTIFIRSLVVTRQNIYSMRTLSYCSIPKKQVNNVLQVSGKHSKLWDIYTLISPFLFIELFSHQNYFLSLSRF